MLISWQGTVQQPPLRPHQASYKQQSKQTYPASFLSKPALVSCFTLIKVPPFLWSPRSMSPDSCCPTHPASPNSSLPHSTDWSQSPMDPILPTQASAPAAAPVCSPGHPLSSVFLDQCSPETSQPAALTPTWGHLPCPVPHSRWKMFL